MNRKNRNIMASFLHSLGSQFHASIPLGDIFEKLQSIGYNPIQEDGTPWSGLLCGADGRALIALEDSTGKPCKFDLVLSWHRFETTGRYELTAYIS